MDSSNKEIIKKEKKNYYFIFSIFIFTVVIFSTAALWFFNDKLEKSIENNNSKITEYSKQIGELKLNNNICSYDIVKDNKSEIQSTITKSMAQRHIDNLIYLSKKLNVQFKWFSFDWSQIWTDVSIVWDIKTDTMLVATNFIKSFRAPDKTTSDTNKTSMLYYLNPISTIWWDYTKRNFTISLDIK